MTTDTITTPAPRGPLTPEAPRGNRWFPTWRGTLLVAAIELHRRRPTTKGWTFYGVTVGGVIALSILIALVAGPGTTTIPLELNLLMILGLGVLIGASLAATSVNGDSTEGVLAPMQMTRLTAGDLAFGKLIASWLVAVIALVTMAPMLVYSYIKADWGLGEVAIMVAVILFTVLTTTAIGLAWSSIAARSIASVALAHLTVGALAIGTLVAFGVATPLVSEEVEVTTRYRDWEAATEEQLNDPSFTEAQLPCVEETHPAYFSHTDRLSGLLLVNPVILLAETAPKVDLEGEATGASVLQLFHQLVSETRMPAVPPTDRDFCADPEFGGAEWEDRTLEALTYPRNPWVGLGTYAVLLAGSLWFTVNRLRVPYRKLKGGTRVA